MTRKSAQKSDGERSEPCAVCGEGTARERVQSVEIQPLGRLVRFKRREWFCQKCKTPYVDTRQGEANDAEELRAKTTALATVGGSDLRFLREQIAHASQPTFERLLGLGTNTVARWETGQRELPAYIASLIRLLALHPAALRDLAALSHTTRSGGGSVSLPSKKVRVSKHTKRSEA